MRSSPCATCRNVVQIRFVYAQNVYSVCLNNLLSLFRNLSQDARLSRFPHDNMELCVNPAAYIHCTNRRVSVRKFSEQFKRGIENIILNIYYKKCLEDI